MEEKTLLVGIDLDRQAPQICIYDKKKGDVAIAPMKVGSGQISLREILDQMEAQSRFGGGEDQAGHNLVLEERAAEIFRRAFDALGLSEPGKQIDGIVATAPSLSKPLVDLLRGVFRRLQMPDGQAWIQDYRESFYYHTLYQKQELWNRNVGFFQFRDHEVTFYSLELNRRSRPVTASVREGDTIYLEESPVRDEIFYQMILNSLGREMYTSIFLMGDEFDKSWAARSTALLCKGGRKVYVVDNLFARGACYAAREKAGEARLAGCLYLGEGLVRKNIGMEMLADGEKTFCRLIPAGVNWYEASGSCEVLLDGSPELLFRISPMDGGAVTQFRMELDGLPERPPRATRLRLELAYDSPSVCRIEAEDLGFGEMYPASGRVWKEIMEG